MSPSINFQRAVGDCFHLVIPTDAEAEIRQAVANSMAVEAAIRRMIQGFLSPEELLESVEPFISDIDSYVEEVEANLDEIYLL